MATKYKGRVKPYVSTPYIKLDQYTTPTVPTLGSSERGFIWNETEAAPQYWNGTAYTTFGATGATALGGLTDCSVATPSDAQILQYVNATSKWTKMSVTGDISISNAGVTAIVSDTIINTDVKSDAAIAWSKMASLSNGHLLVGSAGGVATDVAITGDVSLTNAGVTTVTDLTIAGEAQGDILFRNATNWTRLAAGTAGQALVTAGAGSNPYWGAPSFTTASSLTNNVTCEAGANDYTLAFGAAGGAYTLTIPAVGGSRTFSFINEDETITGIKTFAQTALLLKGGDANTVNIKLNETLTGAKTLNLVIGDTDRTITLGGNIALGGTLTTLGAWTQTGAHSIGITTTNNTTVTLPVSGTLSTLAGSEVLENKTMEATCKWVDTTDNTKAIAIDASGMTTGKTVTLTFANTDNHAVTFPSGVGTVVYADSSASLTNKTIDANGTGNVLSNVNADNFEAINPASAVIGVPFTIFKDVSNAATTAIYTANAPFKFRILDAYTITKGAGNSGTWKLYTGAADITTAINYSGSDTVIGRATSIDDAAWDIAANGTLQVINSVDTDDAYVVITAIRIA